MGVENTLNENIMLRKVNIYYIAGDEKPPAYILVISGAQY